MNIYLEKNFWNNLISIINSWFKTNLSLYILLFFQLTINRVVPLKLSSQLFTDTIKNRVTHIYIYIYFLHDSSLTLNHCQFPRDVRSERIGRSKKNSR